MSRRALIKSIGALFLSAGLVLAAFPTDIFAKEETTVSVASDFKLDGTKLAKYTGTASTVSVPATVTEIGEEAFADNSYMTKLNLPAGLEKIDYAAFSGCNNLEAVVIPDEVEEIGTAAFCNCKKLTSVKLGASVRLLGTGVFTGCDNLSSVSGNSYLICEDGVIYDDEKETLYEVLRGRKSDTYVMPASVLYIKPYAFYGCKNVKNIYISTNIKEIPAYAFSYCNGIKEIEIPYSCTLIDMKAFENCVNLTDVTISSSVSFIHDTAFDGCSKLNIIAPEYSYAYKWFLNWSKSTVEIVDNEDNDPSKNPEQSKDSNITKDNKYWEQGLIGETIIVGRDAFFFIDNSYPTVVSGKNAVDADTAEKPEPTPAYGELVDDMTAVLQKETNGKGLSLPKFAIIDDKIASKAFYGDTKLTEYEIPSNITSIGDFAFARSNIQSVTIPESVTHIGYGAFYHCTYLSKILVPTTVTDIEPSAFANTRMMENWKLYGTSDFMIMGDGILVAYKGSGGKVEIPETVKQIGPECFKNNTYITEVSVPQSVKRICEEAFYGCTNLTNVSGAMGLEIIEDRAFYNCPLSTVRITDSVKSIGMDAFDYSRSAVNYENRCVVFQGVNLPKVSYNKTTTRLTNDSYRNDSFYGINIAIVSSEDILRNNTVLDRNMNGFSGLICVISEPNTEYFNGTLKIIDCTLTASEASSVSIPGTVYIYGKGYNFIASELASVLEMAKSGAYFADTLPDGSEYVSFDGSNDKYLFKMTQDTVQNSDITEAYKRIYNESVPANLNTYTINVSDAKTGVLLTKFGKQELLITTKLPANVSTSNLHVICTDEDSQLEDLPYKVTLIDDCFYVQFSITHTGNYGIYSYNSGAVSAYDLDVTPDTGDRVNPKWFLSVGLLLIGCAMLLYKAKDRQLK